MSGYTGDNEWKDEDHDGKQDKPVWTDYYDLYYTKKESAAQYLAAGRHNRLDFRHWLRADLLAHR